MTEFISPGIALLCVLLTAWNSYVIRSVTTGNNVGELKDRIEVIKGDVVKNAGETGKQFEACRATCDKRIDAGASDIRNLQSTYISRRELDERIASSTAHTDANYASIKDTLETHGRWLEFAVFGKRPEQPVIGGGK